MCVVSHAMENYRLLLARTYVSTHLTAHDRLDMIFKKQQQYLLKAVEHISINLKQVTLFTSDNEKKQWTLFSTKNKQVWQHSNQQWKTAISKYKVIEYIYNAMIIS